MRTEVSFSRLISLVCPQVRGWPAAEQCCAALRQSPAQTIEALPVDRESLLRIYEIRLRRVPDAVVGADRLLNDLRSSSEHRPLMVLLRSEGRIYCMLVDLGLTELVACFVVKDKRWVPVPKATT